MKEKKRRVFTIIFEIVLAFAAALSLGQISHYGITGIDYLLPCMFALCLIVFNKAEKVLVKAKNESAKENSDLPKTGATFVWSGILGTICSVAAVVGSHIDMDVRVFSPMSFADAVYAVFLIPFFAAVLLLLFFSSGVLTLTREDDEAEVTGFKFYRKHFFLYVIIMFVCWLPYYLTYFPGGIGNDDFECTRMCLGLIPWTNHNPVFYVFLMKLFIKIAAGNLTMAFGIMSFLQMIAFAVVLSLSLIWLTRRKTKIWFVYAALCFFALHPIVAIYSIYVTKDVMFACVVILLTLFLLDFCDAINVRDIKKLPAKRWVQLGILSLLTIITRNNGTLIVFLLAVFMVATLKRFRKELLLVFATVFLINGLYKGPVWKLCGIEKQSFAESASIPLSQVAYTICNDGVIEGEDREYLEKLMPFDRVKEEYQPGYTDSYKFSEYFDKELLDSDPMQFLKTWAHLLPNNFGDYVEIYLMQTSGYWDYGISNTVATQGVQYNDLGIVGIDCIEKVLGFSIEGITTELILVARKLPVLCLLSQMAIEILAVILVTINLWRKNRKHLILPMIPLLALWVTIMIATPAHCLFRYMCPIFFMWPLLFCLFFSKMIKCDD